MYYYSHWQGGMGLYVRISLCKGVWIPTGPVKEKREFKRNNDLIPLVPHLSTTNFSPLFFCTYFQKPIQCREDLPRQVCDTIVMMKQKKESERKINGNRIIAGKRKAKGQ